jgi:hypothetical protein
VLSSHDSSAARRPCRPRHPYAVPRTSLQCVYTRRRNCIEQLSTSAKYAPGVRSFSGPEPCHNQTDPPLGRPNGGKNGSVDSLMGPQNFDDRSLRYERTAPEGWDSYMLIVGNFR